jgi:hypothetical protein
VNQDKKSEVAVAADVMANGSLNIGGIARSTRYEVECVRNGRVIWREEFDNLVVTEGLNDSLDKQFKAASYTAAWYVGLTAGTPNFQAGNTMASHAGWTEVTAYDEATRQGLTLGSVSAGSVSNSANKATFTISTNSTTIGGAFLVSNNAKGGSTGVLYGGGAFSANRTLNDGDVLNVTITLTASAA